jgi:CRISPR-associated endonuclease/helicase Cas3
MSTETRQRLREIINLLRLNYPDGLTTTEIAEELGVTRQTALHDIDRLTSDGVPINQEGHRYILSQDYGHELTLSPAQAWMLYVPLRRMVRAQQHRNPLVRSLLRTVTSLLDSEIADPITPDDNEIETDADEVFRELVNCWRESRMVEISYQRLNTAKVTTHVVEPWWLEPGVWTDAIYLVCGKPNQNGRHSILTLKIDRIQKVKKREERFIRPTSQTVLRQIEKTWGIWLGQTDGVKVRLRFHERQVQRLSETQWHPTQVLTLEPGGSAIWEGIISEPKEMIPWIRGWGADVEVLEPSILRDAIIQEVSRLTRLYLTNEHLPKDPSDFLLCCWGKLAYGQRDAETYHPALFHMIDVGNVALALLDSEASPRWRQVLAQAFGVDADQVINWIPYLVALHDLGKFSTEFQGQVEDQKKRLQGQGLPFGPTNKIHHTVSGQISVFFELTDEDAPKFVRLILRDAVGGHHGRFVDPGTARDFRAVITRDEPPLWRELRRQANLSLRSIFYKGYPQGWGDGTNRSAAIMVLTGFIILCDWIGSDERYFTCQPYLPLASYLDISQLRARAAVRQAGFFQPVSSHAATSFRNLFPALAAPRPLQLAIDDIPEAVLAEPCLAILEAPTGEGKTEAALALAHRIGRLRGTDELYYALPTTATSDQMFDRVQKYLLEQLGIGTQVKLVHGQAFLREDDQAIEPMQNGLSENSAETLEWFGPKKRALLAPFGVGTVDQTELCALNTRHNALRFVGLAGKVVILDEVHAYDTYMTAILSRLLGWLSAIGSSVILLSATLPQSRRHQLLKAYLDEGGQTQTIPAGTELAAYPSLIALGRGGFHMASPGAAQPERELCLAVLDCSGSDEDQKARWLLEQIEEGGCACWITNTVDRAQRLFERIDGIASENVERFLIHSRFPLAERRQLEGTITRRFGPLGERPGRGIVIGTQVLEQSLDLDFDLMVSDLAPVDLLLQRAGRLHRHDRQRPDRHALARFTIAVRQHNNDLDLSGDSAVYAEYILRKSWLALKGRQSLHLPIDYRLLIEEVYASGRPSDGNPLEDAWKKLTRQAGMDASEAEVRLIPLPNPIESFCGQVAGLTFDEDENRAGWKVAQTRLGEPSLTVIPLERNGNLARCLGVDLEINMDEDLPRALQLELLRHSLRITHRDVVEALNGEQVEWLTTFGKSALLRETRPLWLENGKTFFSGRSSDWDVWLDKKLGLVIRKSSDKE